MTNANLQSLHPGRIVPFLVVAVMTSMPILLRAQSDPSAATPPASVPNAGRSSSDPSPQYPAKKEAATSAYAAPQPGAVGAQPVYPGLGPSSPPLQTSVGPYTLRFYGTVLFNASTSDSDEVGQDIPLWPLPGAIPVTFPDGSKEPAGHIHDTIFSARQSVFGFTITRTKPLASGWTPSALVEFDFFGTQPVDTLLPQGRILNQPRLRLAYFQIAKGNWKILAGQDRIILSPFDPISLSHVAVPLGYTAGDLWGWFPQVRVDYSRKFGKTSVLLQGGVLRPSFGDPRLNDLPVPGSSVNAVFSGYGERSGWPFYQGHISVSHPWRGSAVTWGAGVHYGKERVGVNHTINSWAAAFDADVPIVSRLTFRGEGYFGSNLVPFGGGILQGVAAIPANPPFTEIRPIHDAGGWAEFTIPATLDYKNVFYVGGGTDDPTDADLLPGTSRSKNSFVWASYFHKLTNQITLAFEWSNWQFLTKGFVNNVPGPKGPSGRGNVFNLALAYQF